LNLPEDELEQIPEPRPFHPHRLSLRLSNLLLPRRPSLPAR
jgi:hypothetical protein